MGRGVLRRLANNANKKQNGEHGERKRANGKREIQHAERRRKKEMENNQAFNRLRCSEREHAAVLINEPRNVSYLSEFIAVPAFLQYFLCVLLSSHLPVGNR